MRTTKKIQPHRSESNFLRYAVPIALMLIAAVFIYCGIRDEEMAVVFTKAINLCRECIGIHGK